MPDELSLLLGKKEEENGTETGLNEPVFMLQARAFPLSVDEEGFAYDFKLGLPPEDTSYPLFDWITFLRLSINDLRKTYIAAIERAALAYCDMKDDVTMDQAMADIENYIRTRVQEQYSEEE